MGIFGFFKGKKPIEVDAEVERIGFGEIGDWLGNKEKGFLKDEKSVLEGIDRKLDEFYVSIEEKLAVLEGIDIEGKKEHGRAKILVRQGLDGYINSVRILLKDLDSIDKSVLDGFVKDVTEAFNRFEKTSAIFYGRANYLIGDEMAAVRNGVRRFYNDLAVIFEKSLIRDLKKVDAVKLKLGEITKVENDLRDAEEEIIVRDKKISEAEDLVKRLDVEVEEIRKSSEYTSGMRAREEIENLEAGLNKEIGKLKELIDFKRLTNLVHSNEREMGIVKDYRAHFVIEFSKDNGERLFGLMEGTSIKSAEIVAKVGLIEKKKIELDEARDGVGKDYTLEKLKEIDKIGEERESIELENIKGDRRMKELDLKLKGLKSEVVLLVEGLGVEVK